MRVGGNPNWVKGGPSPNPSGKSPLAKQFRVKAISFASELVIEAWAQEVRERGPDWVKCSALLAAYAYGTPSPRKEAEDDDIRRTINATMSIEEMRVVNETVRLARAIGPGEEPDDGESH